MKKKLSLTLLLLSILGLSGCGNKNTSISYIDHPLSFDGNNNISISVDRGTLGSFNLLTPSDNATLNTLPTFTWEASANAYTYTIEICSREDFVHDSTSIPYIKESNISVTSYTLSAPLRVKNITYYWRVTAVNPFNPQANRNLECNQIKSFYFEAASSDEISIPIGEEADWQLHKEGSYADIRVDTSNFFNGNEKESLAITFDKEHTNQGIVSSDGWIIVTKAIELDLYGTDSVMFNFYYAGNDADVLIRFVDTDGEYWYCPIKVSQNAKQTVLMKFSDFILRTKDTLVQNQVFDYEHMQNIELVFEHSFGDGACMIGNIRAVNYDDYSDLFVSKLNFNNLEESQFQFETDVLEKVISGDGSELTLNHGSITGGYDFCKVLLNSYFSSGNALKIKIKYTGYKTNSNVIIRILEEDQDRWKYEQPYSSLTEGEYSELIIPFTAFAKSEIRGDGNRQFYYILQLQLGCNNMFGNGTLSFKDIEIVTIPNVSQNKKEVGSDGVIDNFDQYSFRTQIYEHWETSVENKDEGIFLSNKEKFINGTNINCGEFTYKSDMSMATYDTYLDVSYNNGNAIKFWAKDATPKKNDIPSISYLNADDVVAEMVIQIVLKDGRWYRYNMPKLSKLWHEYIINFADFELFSGVITDESIPLVSENVVNFAFGVQYFYKTQDGKGYPVYTESNPVYLDEICFTSGTTAVHQLEKEIEPDVGNPKLVTVDTFEYDSELELTSRWVKLNNKDFENIELSNDVSSKGGEHSMKLDYKGSNSPSYATYPKFSSNCGGYALKVDLKGDNKAIVYINIYIKNGSTATEQYRYTIYNLPDVWKEYTIGIDGSLFKRVDVSSGSLTSSKIPSIDRITFGIVSGSVTSVSSIYVDNLRFSKETGVDYLSETSVVIDQ